MPERQPAELLLWGSMTISEQRPWGSFHVLDEGPGYKVKKIVVNPGGRLSLQSHFHRSERWTIVSGLATVTVEGIVTKLSSGEFVVIPVQARHRLESLDGSPLVVIEVQLGDCLSEDDIVRYHDAYRRNET